MQSFGSSLYNKEFKRQNLSFFSCGQRGIAVHKYGILADKDNVVPTYNNVVISSEYTEKFQPSENNYGYQSRGVNIYFNIVYTSQFCTVASAYDLFVSQIGNAAFQNISLPKKSLYQKSSCCASFLMGFVFLCHKKEFWG